MKKAYDIVVIGGGIVGSAIAFELAKRGLNNTLLIEKRYLTSGATGRCGDPGSAPAGGQGYDRQS